MTATNTLPAFTARQCPICDEWVDCSGEGTNTHSDYKHMEERHPERLDPNAIGFPFFLWNETDVEV